MVLLSSVGWRILLVDDDEDDYLITREMLRESQGQRVELEWVSTYEAGRQSLLSNTYHAVIVDYDLGSLTGIDLIRETVARGYSAPMILFTGRGSHQVDIEAMKAGAALYLTKGEITALSLERFIRYAIERKRIEQELEKQHQQRSIILESIQDGLFGIDQDWRITYINTRAALNSGYSPEELTGQNIWVAFPKLLGTELEANYRRAMTERIPLRFETRSVYRDVWYNIMVYPSAEGIAVYWQDITEQKQAEAELRERQVQMEIQRRLLDYREQERQLIGHDLHDGPVQELSGLLFNMQIASELVTDPEVKSEMDHVDEGLKRTIQNLRKLINELRPPSLLHLGLAKALQIYLIEFGEKHPEIDLNISLMDDGDFLPGRVRLNLFRIVQEALNNLIRHAGATRAAVRLSCTKQETVLEVQDNGKGFEVLHNLLDYSSLGNFGLVGMKERAEAIGGKFHLCSQPGAGTKITIAVPCPCMRTGEPIE